MITHLIGSSRITRVSYFDVPLDADVIGLTRDQVKSVTWGTPDWATPEGHVLVGQAIWVIESGDRTIVVDPCGASDAFLRTGPEAATHQSAVITALEAGGFPVENVNTVVLSHLDGIGMAGSVDPDGRWSPLFPNATVELTELELAHVESHPEIGGASALLQLCQQGVVRAMPTHWAVTPDVTAEHTGGHSPGHVAIRIGDGAVFLGHLAVSPLQAAFGSIPHQHLDDQAAHEALEFQLEWAMERNALVIGPLWPGPGAGRVSGPPWVVIAA